MCGGFQSALGSLAEQVVADDKGGHCLNHRYGARQHTGIMPATTLEFSIRSCVADGWLLCHDGGGGLEGNPKADGLPVGYASLDSPGVIGVGAHASVIHVKVIVMLLTGKQGAPEAGADLESLGGRQAHHRPGEVRLQFVEDGCTRVPAGSLE